MLYLKIAIIIKFIINKKNGKSGAEGMANKGMTAKAVKQINKNKVYAEIYRGRSVSKMQIVQKLQMGLSTVDQNLKALEEEGLIEKKGYFESTGGRKAQAIQICRTARISIGIGILKECIYIVAADLYGTVLQSAVLTIPYRHADTYYERLGREIDSFISAHGLDSGRILGVSVAVQGSISPDGQAVSYGAIMHNEQMKLSDFQKHIPYACRLEHDSKAAAFLELWRHPDIQSASMFLLNHNMGGAVIINGLVHQGLHMQSGNFEHLCIEKNGPLCYCGSRGCLETYCSVNALEKAAGMALPLFFEEVRKKEAKYLKIWSEYLKYLAFAIRNVSAVVDGKIIISGYLAPFLVKEDVAFLLQHINESNAFPVSGEQFLLGTQGAYTQATGAALYQVNTFLTSLDASPLPCRE